MINEHTKKKTRSTDEIRRKGKRVNAEGEKREAVLGRDKSPK
jgi:hypothetical protein